MPRRALAALALAALALAPVAAQAAAPSPAVVAGWPVTAPAGTALRGPDRGVVLVSSAGVAPTVRAYRRDGRLRWRTTQPLTCGTCRDTSQPPRLQPDGTYGPLPMDPYWAVDARGRKVPACDGVVYPDGSCAYVQQVFPNAPTRFEGPYPAFSGPGYRIVDTRVWWNPENAPRLVRDDGGRLYAGLIDLTNPGGFSGAAPSRITAIDPATSAIAWSVLGPTEAMLGLESGVLARTATGLVALGGDGSTRWTRGLAEDRHVDAVGLDRRNHLIHLNVSVPLERRVPPVGLVLDAATGRTVWRTANRDRARFLSLGARGRSYVAIDRPGQLAVRALDAAGRTLWERRTSSAAFSARELADGTVAVSFGTSLTLLDPRRR